MIFNNLIPLGGSRKDNLARHTDSDLFYALERQIGSLFGDFFKGFDLEPYGFSRRAWHSFTPQLDVRETNKEINISAELPGMDEKDVEVTVEDDVLTIQGEKKEEREAKDENKGYYRAERAYGAFQRSFVLPTSVDKEKVKAQFKKGILEVVLPKKPEAQIQKKKIDVIGS